MMYLASCNQEQINMRVFLRVYPLVFLCSLFSSVLFAQVLEPEYVEVKVLQGETFTYDFYSSQPASLFSSDNAFGSYEVTEVLRNQNYRLTYTSANDFVGASRFILERYSNIGTLKSYTELVIKVVPSMLTAVTDVVFMPRGTNQVSFDPLTNDIQGQGPSSLRGVELVSE